MLLSGVLAQIPYVEQGRAVSAGHISGILFLAGGVVGATRC